MYAVSLEPSSSIIRAREILYNQETISGFPTAASLRCLDLVIMRLVSGSKFASIGIKYQKENSFTIRLDESCRLRQHTLDVVIAAKLYP